MSVDKVRLSSSVEVPESTPVVTRRNSDDEKRASVGAAKRSSNPFVAFPSTEEPTDLPSYVIPRRHSDDDKRVIERSRNPFGETFKSSDFGRKTKVEVKNETSDFLSRQVGTPIQNETHISSILPKKGLDQSSQTPRRGSDSDQATQTTQTVGNNETQQYANSTTVPVQPHGILRRGSGPDQTFDSVRRNSGPRMNDDVDLNILSDAPRRPSVHFADMPRRSSDPIEKEKEQYPDTLRRSSEPEHGYLDHRKAWEQFPEVACWSSGPAKKCVAHNGGRVIHEATNLNEFPDVIRLGSDPKSSFQCQEVFPEAARPRFGSCGGYVQNVGIQVQDPFSDTFRNSIACRESCAVDSGVQTSEFLPDQLCRSFYQKDTYLESVGVQADLSRRGSREKPDNSGDPAQSDSGVGISASVPKKSTSASVDERLAQRRRSLVPMSSMEEESLRERLHMVHLRCCSEIVLREPRYSRETFRKLFQNKEFLEQCFKLFDQDRHDCLEQESWIEFLKQRLTNEKHVDFVEQLESVAYCLCGERPIYVEQFYQIFYTKGITEKLFRLVDSDNSGTVSSDIIMDFLATVTNTMPCTGFDKGSIDRLEQLFRQTVGNGKEIKRQDFKKIVTSKNPFFTDRVFEIFDKDNSGTISLQEFLDAMHQFAGQTSEDKTRFLFKVYDLDGDGLIQHKELQHVMQACMEENGMHFSEDQIDDLTMALFEDADAKNRGAITYEALKKQLEKHEGLLENLCISIDRWLVPPKQESKATPIFKRLLSYKPYQLTLPYLKNNYVFLLFLLALFLVNAGLFISRAIQYRGSNWYTIFARACGQCLNFNCAFILVLMLRHTITFLRTRGFSSIILLDNHIYFHKLIGVVVFGYSVLHTIMHVCNFTMVVVHSPVLNARNFTAPEWLFTSKPGLFGLIGGLANPTGFILMLILCVMFICSQPFVRRGGCFEVFYYTHLLYMPFWVLLILHGPNFWKWFVFPGVAFGLERAYRSLFIVTERGKTYISSGILLPSKVTHLVIKRPAHFDFHAGDYVFVNIPAIAKYEWHPFTLSSAPEQDDYMWLHIRGVGQWTNKLYEYFEKEQEKLHNGEIEAVPCCSKPKKRISNGSIEKNGQTTLKKIQSSIRRTLSKRDKNKQGAVQLVGFSNENYQNDGSEDEIDKGAENSEGNAKMPNERNLRKLIFSNKAPLEKSLSVPDMQTKEKKRERILVLREYMRSESEKSFNTSQIRKARMQSLGLAYLSPQNKSLAQSFRYMRNKPTIIAFKTPSLENCEQRQSSSSFGSVAQVHADQQRHAEEGRIKSRVCESSFSPSFSLQPVNYPVGKPLEPMSRRKKNWRGKTYEDVKIKISENEGTEIYIDGPYGAPSSHIFRAQHAVLIATGIGVTPFASILQSIMHKYWKARHLCPRCTFSWSSEIPATVMNLRKVDFFWINRDQRSFEWFVNLLSQLEIEQAELGGAMERFLEMHMYITSALQKTDMKAVGLQLALDLLHEKEKRDLITGLKTRTIAGRPNWDKVFKQIAGQKKGKVTIFFCGPPNLSRILRVKADQYGFNFRKEVF